MTLPAQITATTRDTGADAVAAATRRLIDAVVRAGSAMDALAGDLVAALDRLSAEIDAGAPDSSTRMADIWTSAGHRRHDPCCGTENPIAPPLVLHQLADGSVIGRLVLGLPYQGPPGLVHGGISALLLDHTLGLANSRAGTPGVTADLRLRYLRPVPLFSELTITARRLSAEGRKLFAEGAISVDGEVCVQAEGLWITTPRTRYRPDFEDIFDEAQEKRQ